MGLTVYKKQRLAGKGFPTLYEDHQAEWATMLANAVEYVDKNLPTGERILPDDLQKVLVDMVAVNLVFTAYLEEKSLRQKYWAADFSDHIIDERYGRELVERGNYDE